MENLLIFDIFTVNSFFQYEARKRIPSYPGLFFSLILYVFLVYTIIISDMVQNKNPKISDMILSERRGNYVATSNNFILGIQLFDIKGRSVISYIDPSIWNIKVFNFQENDLNLVNCSFDSIDSLCLNNSEFILNKNNHITIDITRCKNSTYSSIICKPEEDIYNFIAGINFVLLYNSEFSFDLNNYEAPLEQTSIRLIDTFINPNKFELHEFYMRPIEFFDSKNVFYEQEEEGKRLFQKDYERSSSQTYERNAANFEYFYEYHFIAIHFSLSPTKRVISRKYQTFTELMSQLGGLISISRLFGSLFLSIFPFFIMKRNLFQKLYWIPQNKVITDKGISKIEEEEVEKEKKFENSAVSMIPKIPLSSYLRRDQENEYSSSRTEDFKSKCNRHPEVKELNRKNSHFLLQCVENLKKRIEEKNKIDRKLNFSFYNYVKNKFKSFFKMKLDFEGQTILSADKMNEKEIDIVQILKRIQDVEKLKCILLTENQRKIFDLIKPRIKNVFQKEPDAASSKGKSVDLSEIILKSLDIGQNEDEQREEIQKVIAYYEEKLSSDDEEGLISEIDRNLLNFFKE